MVGLIAPRPFLFENGAHDPTFPIDEVRGLYDRARRVYGFYGASDRIRQEDWPLPHGWAQPLREASCGWLIGWLRGTGPGESVPEQQGIEPLPPDAEALQCFKDGRPPSDAESIVTLNRKRAAELIEAYATPPETGAEWEGRSGRLRRAIWEVFGGRPEAYSPRPRSVGTFEWEGCTVERLAIATEARMEVPALLIRPGRAAGPYPAVIFVDEKDKSAVRSSRAVSRLLDLGAAVLAIDPRWTGEIETHSNQTAGDAVALGRPLLAQRTWDVMQAARYLADRDDIDAARVFCYGYGAGGLLALFAGALDDTLAGVGTERTLASFVYAIVEGPIEAYPYMPAAEVAHYPRACQAFYPPLWVFAPNMLKAADVPQVTALALHGTVVCANPTGYGRRCLSRRQAEEAMHYASSVGDITGAAAALTVATGTDAAVARQIVACLLR